jgi:hypothetical protein
MAKITVKSIRSAVKRARASKNNRTEFSTQCGLCGELCVTDEGIQVVLNTEVLGTFSNQDKIAESVKAYVVEEVGEDTDEEEFVDVGYNPKDIRTRHITITAAQVVGRIKDDGFDFSPGFQRRPDVWSQKAKSRFIESLLMGIMIPGFYFSEDEDGVWGPIDGLQRVCTLRSFVLQEMPLKGLETRTDLNGKRYDDLTTREKRMISESQLRAFVVEDGTPIEFKIVLFHRLNTSQNAVKHMEVLNACMPGIGRDMINDVADSQAFLTATGGKVPTLRMQDRSMVLRCALFLTVAGYNGKLKSSVTECMKDLNGMSQGAIDEIKSKLISGFTRASDVFGEGAFRKVTREGKPGPINKCLMEIQVIQLANLSEQQYQDLDADMLVELLKDAIADDEAFLGSITSGTNKAAATLDRHTVFESLIDQALEG